MKIAENVKALSEVGNSLVLEAEKLDAREATLETMQKQLAIDRQAFVNSLQDEWTAQELTSAGIYGFEALKSKGN